MSQKQAYWGWLMFVLGVVLARHQEFLEALALDRQILLTIGIIGVLVGPRVVAILRNER